MFGFFVMGFVDIVGISTSYVKADFASQLPEHWFGFLPSVVLVWFLVLSIPTSLLMNSIGRKNTVLLSVAITFAGMAVPFINYNLYTCLVGFAFLGIGNAVLQVSLMPLLTNVVSAQKLASAATGGQAVKAVSSFAGPFIAFFCSVGTGLLAIHIPHIRRIHSSFWAMALRGGNRKGKAVANGIARRYFRAAF